MLRLAFNPTGDDAARRAQLFSGTILLQSSTTTSRALCSFAQGVVQESFGSSDPEHAQEQLSVEEFIALVAPMKSRFTNAQQTKELIRTYLVEQGIDAEKTYFDVPRMRVVPHSSYLSAGVSYAYKAHRDIWYSSPAAQVNWWLPVWDVTVERTMAFYPSYWDRALANSSADFDYGEWVRVGRAQAVSRYGARMGDAIVFSAAQLHATAPNTSGATRFSMDFRTVHIDDLQSGRGAPNIDSRARGSTLGDFLRVSDFSPLAL